MANNINQPSEASVNRILGIWRGTSKSSGVPELNEKKFATTAAAYVDTASNGRTVPNLSEFDAELERTGGWVNVGDKLKITGDGYPDGVKYIRPISGDTYQLGVLDPETDEPVAVGDKVRLTDILAHPPETEDGKKAHMAGYNALKAFSDYSESVNVILGGKYPNSQDRLALVKTGESDGTTASLSKVIHGIGADVSVLGHGLDYFGRPAVTPEMQLSDNFDFVRTKDLENARQLDTGNNWGSKKPYNEDFAKVIPPRPAVSDIKLGENFNSRYGQTWAKGPSPDGRNISLLDENTFKMGDVILSIPPTHITVTQLRSGQSTPIIGYDSKTSGSYASRIAFKVNLVFAPGDVDTDLKRILTQFRYCPFNIVHSAVLYDMVIAENSWLAHSLARSAGHKAVPVTMDEYTLYTIPNHPKSVGCSIQMSLFNYGAYFSGASDAQDPCQYFMATFDDGKLSFDKLITEGGKVVPRVTTHLEDAIHPYNTDITEILKDPARLFDAGEQEIQFTNAMNSLYPKMKDPVSHVTFQKITSVMNYMDMERGPITTNELQDCLLTVLAESVSVRFENNFAWHPVLGYSQPVAQYIGPGETIISINFKLPFEKTAVLEKDGEDVDQNKYSRLSMLLKTYMEKTEQDFFSHYDDRYLVHTGVTRLAECQFASLRDVGITSIPNHPNWADVNITLFKAPYYQSQSEFNKCAEYDEYWDFKRLLRILDNEKIAQKIADYISYDDLAGNSSIPNPKDYARDAHDKSGNTKPMKTHPIITACRVYVEEKLRAMNAQGKTGNNMADILRESAEEVPKGGYEKSLAASFKSLRSSLVSDILNNVPDVKKTTLAGYLSKSIASEGKADATIITPEGIATAAMASATFGTKEFSLGTRYLGEGIGSDKKFTKVMRDKIKASCQQAIISMMAILEESDKTKFFISLNGPSGSNAALNEAWALSVSNPGEARVKLFGDPKDSSGALAALSYVFKNENIQKSEPENIYKNVWEGRALYKEVKSGDEYNETHMHGFRDSTLHRTGQPKFTQADLDDLLKSSNMENDKEGNGLVANLVAEFNNSDTPIKYPDFDGTMKQSPCKVMYKSFRRPKTTPNIDPNNTKGFIASPYQVEWDIKSEKGGMCKPVPTQILADAQNQTTFKTLNEPANVNGSLTPEEEKKFISELNLYVKPFAAHRWFPRIDNFIKNVPLASGSVGGWWFCDIYEIQNRMSNTLSKGVSDGRSWALDTNAWKNIFGTTKDGAKHPMADLIDQSENQKDPTKLLSAITYPSSRKFSQISADLNSDDQFIKDGSTSTEINFISGFNNDQTKSPEEMRLLINNRPFSGLSDYIFGLDILKAGGDPHLKQLYTGMASKRLYEFGIKPELDVNSLEEAAKGILGKVDNSQGLIYFAEQFDRNNYYMGRLVGDAKSPRIERPSVLETKDVANGMFQAEPEYDRNKKMGVEKPKDITHMQKIKLFNSKVYNGMKAGELINGTEERPQNTKDQAPKANMIEVFDTTKAISAMRDFLVDALYEDFYVGKGIQYLSGTSRSTLAYNGVDIKNYVLGQLLDNGTAESFAKHLLSEGIIKISDAEGGGLVQGKVMAAKAAIQIAVLTAQFSLQLKLDGKDDSITKQSVNKSLSYILGRVKEVGGEHYNLLAGNFKGTTGAKLSVKTFGKYHFSFPIEIAQFDDERAKDVKEDGYQLYVTDKVYNGGHVARYTGYYVSTDLKGENKAEGGILDPSTNYLANQTGVADAHKNKIQGPDVDNVLYEMCSHVFKATYRQFIGKAVESQDSGILRNFTGSKLMFTDEAWRVLDIKKGEKLSALKSRVTKALDITKVPSKEAGMSMMQKGAQIRGAKDTLGQKVSDASEQFLATSYMYSMMPTFGLQNAYPTFKLYIIDSDLSDIKYTSLDDYWDMRLMQDVMVVKSKDNPQHILRSRIVIDPRYITISNDMAPRGLSVQDVSSSQYRDASGRINPSESRIPDPDIYEIGTRAEQKFNMGRAPIRVGMRICLKLGYHSDPRLLDTVFIGTITGLNPGMELDVFDLEAIGDGRELSGPATVANQDFSGNNFGEVIAKMLRANPNVIHFGKNYGTVLERFSREHFLLYAIGKAAFHDFSIGKIMSHAMTGMTPQTDEGVAGILAKGLGFTAGAALTIGGCTLGWAGVAGAATLVAVGGTGAAAYQYMKELQGGKFINEQINNKIFDMTDNWHMINARKWLNGSTFDLEKASRQLGRKFYEHYSYNHDPVDENIWAVDIWANLFHLGDKQYSLPTSNRRSIWEILVDIKRLYPNYAVDVRPYGSRSTLYLGPTEWAMFRTDDPMLAMAPQFIQHSNPNLNSMNNYFEQAYKADGLLRRNAESEQAPLVPFQRHHICTSDSNIIMNGIKSTPFRGYNAVVINWGDQGQKQEDLVANAEIFPGSLKRQVFEATWINNSAFARQYALGCLKEGVEKMYGGTLVISGNPKVEPYDKVYVYDKVNQMYGWVEVETVIHKFDHNFGFTTHIVPNMVCSINSDGYKLMNNIARSVIFSNLTVGQLAAFGIGAGAFMGASVLMGPVLSSVITLGTLGVAAYSSFGQSYDVFKKYLNPSNTSFSETDVYDTMRHSIEFTETMTYQKLSYVFSRGMTLIGMGYADLKKGKPMSTTVNGVTKWEGSIFRRDIGTLWAKIHSTILSKGEVGGFNVFHPKVQQRNIRISLAKQIQLEKIAGLPEAAGLTDETLTLLLEDSDNNLSREKIAELLKARRSLLEKELLDVQNKLKNGTYTQEQALKMTKSLETTIEAYSDGNIETKMKALESASKSVSEHKGKVNKINQIKNKAYDPKTTKFLKGGAGLLTFTSGVQAAQLGLMILPLALETFIVNSITKSSCISIYPIWSRHTLMMAGLEGYQKNNAFMHMKGMVMYAKEVLDQMFDKDLQYITPNLGVSVGPGGRVPPNVMDTSGVRNASRGNVLAAMPLPEQALKNHKEMKQLLGLDKSIADTIAWYKSTYPSKFPDCFAKIMTPEFAMGILDKECGISDSRMASSVSYKDAKAGKMQAGNSGYSTNGSKGYMVGNMQLNMQWGGSDFNGPSKTWIKEFYTGSANKDTVANGLQWMSQNGYIPAEQRNKFMSEQVSLPADIAKGLTKAELTRYLDQLSTDDSLNMRLALRVIGQKFADECGSSKTSPCANKDVSTIQRNVINRYHGLGKATTPDLLDDYMNRVQVYNRAKAINEGGVDGTKSASFAQTKANFNSFKPKLDKNFAALLDDKFIASVNRELADKGFQIRIHEGFRTVQEQTTRYQDYLAKLAAYKASPKGTPPTPVADPRSAKHPKGMAIDIALYDYSDPPRLAAGGGTLHNIPAELEEAVWKAVNNASNGKLKTLLKTPGAPEWWHIEAV